MTAVAALVFVAGRHGSVSKTGKKLVSHLMGLRPSGNGDQKNVQVLNLNQR